MEEAGGQQALHHQGDAAVAREVGHHVASGRFHVGDVRGAGADPLEVLQRQRHLRFPGHGQQVQHDVGGAAHGHADGDGVLESLLGHDVAGADVLLQQPRDGAPDVAGLTQLAGVDGRNRGVARQRHPHHLDGGCHGVGGEQAGAGPLAGAGAALQVAQFVEGDVALCIAAHGLEHVLDVHVPAVVLAGHYRAAVHEQARHVQPRQRHHAAGHVLVAPGDGDQAVHPLPEGDQLDGVGDDLAADQRGLHALGAHGDAVADGDGAELEGDALSGANPLLGGLGEAAQMDVAGGDVAGQVGDGDEGLFHVLVGDAHGHQHGAGRCSLQVVGDLGTAVLGLCRLSDSGWRCIGGSHWVISIGVVWVRLGGTKCRLDAYTLSEIYRAIIGCDIMRHKAGAAAETYLRLMTFDH